MKSKNIAIVAGVVVVLLIVLFANQNRSQNQEPADITRERMTLTGTYLCLPHRDTSGPQTLECALGLKTDDGTYYALDFNLLSQMPPEIATGERISASGIFTPVEMLSTDMWQKYPIKGIFSVTDSVKKL